MRSGCFSEFGERPSSGAKKGVNVAAKFLIAVLALLLVAFFIWMEHGHTSKIRHEPADVRAGDRLK